VLDDGEDLLKATYFKDFGGDRYFYSGSVLATALYTQKNTQISLGARSEFHSYSGFNASPTASILQKVGRFYGRFSFSSIKRLPTLINVDLAPEGEKLKPATITTTDVEFGYKYKKLLIGVNFFTTQTVDAIFYRADFAGQERYRNTSPFTNNGFELFASKKIDKFSYKIGYTSYMHGRSQDSTNPYAVPGKRSNIGLSSNKIVASVNGAVFKNLDFSFLCIYQSSKYGRGTETTLPDSIQLTPRIDYIKYPSELICNFFLHYKISIANGMDLTSGIVNIFNSPVSYVQTYQGGHMPLPGPSREYIIRISYALAR
jgi:hypothetical protein